MTDQQPQPDRKAAWPVLTIPSDPPIDSPPPGLALCLSGGGFRAMLFHVGTLWRLNQLGYLSRLERVSSVSGGSITAGVLGLQWQNLAFDAAGVAQAFEHVVVAPIAAFARQTVDVPAIARGIFSAVTASSRSHVARAHCAAACLAIVQRCCCLQQAGSCFDCQTGGKPLTQIARIIKKTDARSMRTRR